MRWTGSRAGSRASSRSAVWIAASVAPLLTLVREQRRQRLKRELVQALALDEEPLLEW